MDEVKEIYNLKEEDFERSPYWMFYSGKESEYDEFVNLIPQTHEDYDANSVRLIKTKYTLNNGKEINGYMYEDTSIENHTLFFEKLMLSTWYGITEPKNKEICDTYLKINMEPNLVFPITYSTINSEYSGVIEGFGFINENEIIYKK